MDFSIPLLMYLIRFGECEPNPSPNPNSTLTLTLTLTLTKVLARVKDLLQMDIEKYVDAVETLMTLYSQLGSVDIATSQLSQFSQLLLEIKSLEMSAGVKKRLLNAFLLSFKQLAKVDASTQKAQPSSFFVLDGAGAGVNVAQGKCPSTILTHTLTYTHTLTHTHTCTHKYLHISHTRSYILGEVSSDEGSRRFLLV